MNVADVVPVTPAVRVSVVFHFIEVATCAGLMESPCPKSADPDAIVNETEPVVDALSADCAEFEVSYAIANR